MLLEGDDGFSFSRDMEDTIQPNLTLPDPSLLNGQIQKLRRESEELLKKVNHKLDHPESGDLDGSATLYPLMRPSELLKIVVHP